MLKIGLVKWRGKCARHPGFDPEMDGPGGVKGNCQRCQDLVLIYDLHQKIIRLMRTFRPVEAKKVEEAAASDDRQLDLFA